MTKLPSPIRRVADLPIAEPRKHLSSIPHILCVKP